MECVWGTTTEVTKHNHLEKQGVFVDVEILSSGDWWKDRVKGVYVTKFFMCGMVNGRLKCIFDV